MISIHEETAIKELFKKEGIPLYRYAQLEHAFYKKRIEAFEDMSILPKEVREILQKEVFIQSIALQQSVQSSDGKTEKFLFKTQHGKYIESVLLRHLTGRNTACISSQIGCPVKCSFCATGAWGFFGNLEFYEIVEQVEYIKRYLENTGECLRNVVYMGMGEPFLNYAHVKESLRILWDQKKYNISFRKITVSTCGIPDAILAFSYDFPQVSLAISLHAPFDDIRNELVPINRVYPLSLLLVAIDQYIERTNKKVFLEYTCIRWVNDSDRCAYALWEMFAWKLVHVNFIIYHPSDCIPKKYFPASLETVKKFQNILQSYHIPSTLRISLWEDILAACWQLSWKQAI